MHPRWEDYNYELADPVDNRLHWLGDGQTYNEKTLTGDRTCSSLRSALHVTGKSLTLFPGAWYLRAPFLDVPPGEFDAL